MRESLNWRSGENGYSLQECIFSTRLKQPLNALYIYISSQKEVMKFVLGVHRPVGKSCVIRRIDTPQPDIGVRTIPTRVQSRTRNIGINSCGAVAGA